MIVKGDKYSVSQSAKTDIENNSINNVPSAFDIGRLYV